MGKRATAYDHNEIGLFFYSREAYDLAIAEFRLALRITLAPSASLYVNLGAAYLGKKMYAEAANALRLGLRLDPRNARGHWFLGQALLGAGELTAALAEYERVGHSEPDATLARSAEEAIERLRRQVAEKANTRGHSNPGP